MTTSDTQWQGMAISANFHFFRITEEPKTKHPKENSLNIEENLEELIVLTLTKLNDFFLGRFRLPRIHMRFSMNIYKDEGKKIRVK